LVRRPRHAVIMADMWELPEVEKARPDGSEFLTLRHSITTTDYTVKVWQEVCLSNVDGKWIGLKRVGRIALTGLAKKILARAELTK
jgi:hypothetical protein